MYEGGVRPRGGGGGGGGGGGRGFAADQAELQADLEALRARVEGAAPPRGAGPSPAEREAAARRRREREAGGARGGGGREPSPREWAAHEAAWARFEGDGGAEASEGAVPWPPGEGRGLLAHYAREAAEAAGSPAGAGAGGAAAGGGPLRAAFRRASLRWHPDKFAARLGGRLPADPEARAAVLARAAGVAQRVNEDHAALLAAS